MGQLVPQLLASMNTMLDYETTTKAAARGQGLAGLLTLKKQSEFRANLL